jgi:TolB-like protein
MQKILLFTLFGLIFLSNESWTQQKKTTIAVLEFQRTGGLEASEAATLTNRFRGLLVQTEAFEVIERDKMADILKEQDFTMSDQCNSAECAVQIGQLLGVQAMIAGDIGKLGQTWTIDVRMIDVNTGKILKTHNEDHKGEIDGLLEVMKKIAEKFAAIESSRSKEIAKEDKSKNVIKDDKTKDVVKEDKGKIKEDKTKDVVKEDKGKDKTKEDKGTTGGQTITTKKGGFKTWYIVGGAVLVGGGAAAILSGGGKKGGAPGIPIPSWPTDHN